MQTLLTEITETYVFTRYPFAERPNYAIAINGFAPDDEKTHEGFVSMSAHDESSVSIVTLTPEAAREIAHRLIVAAAIAERKVAEVPF